MPMKKLLHRLQPIQVYIVLILSLIYFLVQIFIANKSHSITLLVHAYHMLCNIIALSGCIITIKNTDQNIGNEKLCGQSESDEKLPVEVESEESRIKNRANEQQKRHEKSLKNTFGWARVDILTMVICCTFLTSLCFSIVVEVIQTLFHINHHGDHMEHQDEDDYHLFTYEFCIILGALGLVLNGISYLLIGGYTYHQGSFLHLTSDGNVYILNRVDVDGMKLANPKYIARKSQKVHEIMRDSCSAFFVIVCSIIVVFCQEKDNLAVKMIDPAFSLLSIAVLLFLSYPYMKEAARVLLQTIPDTIDIEDFQKRILNKFPQLESIHDLHIWQLTRQNYVSTAHIIFNDPSVYKTIMNDIIAFFHEEGINIVTLQPEFKNLGEIELSQDEIQSLVTKDSCLVSCREPNCDEKLCCMKESSPILDDKESIKLEQVISVKNISAQELKTMSQCTSEKSLDICDNHSSSNDVVHHKKRSVTSLYTTPSIKHNKKLQKAISAIDHEHQMIVMQPSTSDDNQLNKKFVSESVIKSVDLDRQKSEILVENRLLKQLNTTNNEETEDLYNRHDTRDQS